MALVRLRTRSAAGAPTRHSYFAALKEEMVRRPALSFLPPLDAGSSGPWVREDVWERISASADEIRAALARARGEAKQ